MKKDACGDQKQGISLLAVDHASIIAIWMNPQGELVYANRAACSSLGYAEEDLLGRSIESIDSRLKPGTWNSFWKALEKEGSVNLESLYRKADGTAFPVNVSANLIKSGGREYACAFVQDIRNHYSGEEAVSYMKDHSADLVLLDMILEQGIDGLETYERILRIHPGQKAVIASGYSETDRVRKAQNLGAGRYIKKPYLIEALGIAIMLELRKKESSSENAG